jgi:hypothetical protein
MRNTEYFNDIELGRTLFGYQFNPSVYIQPNANVKLQAGIFLRSDFGGDPVYTQILPTFSLKLQKNKTSFLFGTLEGALAHRMIEPLFDINSAIERRIENGFQIRHVSDETFFDLWINWEKFIERGSPYKEQFTAGMNFTPTLVNNNNGFTVSVPIQFMAFHRGGQITTDTSNMLMVFNGTVGLVAKQELQNSFVNLLEGSIYSVGFQENTNSGYLPYRNGLGTYANAFINTKWLGLMLSYWDAKDFIAPRGTTIYQSVSIDKAGFYQENRQLLFLRFLYQKEVYKDLFLVARAEPFYDFGSGITDYSYSLYLTYRHNFNLVKIK